MEYEVDQVTCKKAGTLAAYGLVDRALADALLLTEAQVAFMKTTPEFQEAYSQGVATRAQRAIDLEDGWDTLEEQALVATLETLKFNRDPRFALHAAFTANRATRRVPTGNNRIIDASRAGNVIVLNLNQTFITKKLQSDGQATLDITPRDQINLPKKSHDIPTPNRVTQLLGITNEKKTQQQEYKELCEVNGITPEMFDE